MPVAVLLGSAFDTPPPDFVPRSVQTAWGDVVVHEGPRGFLVFRHGVPHRWLPNQIPYRAHTAALKQLGVTSLLVTSSVGLLNPALPLFTPLLVEDLVWLDNRLPDGTACTMWPEPSASQGHLVVETGLFSQALSQQVREIAKGANSPVAPDPVTFWYAPGPRTKTPAENRVLAGMRMDVNSMTLAPEVVLANELEIPCAAVVVGHKASGPGMGTEGVRASLVDAREAVQRLVLAFLDRAEPVPFANHVYRFL